MSLIGKDGLSYTIYFRIAIYRLCLSMCVKVNVDMVVLYCAADIFCNILFTLDE